MTALSPLSGLMKSKAASFRTVPLCRTCASKYARVRSTLMQQNSAICRIPFPVLSPRFFSGSARDQKARGRPHHCPKSTVGHQSPSFRRSLCLSSYEPLGQAGCRGGSPIQELGVTATVQTDWTGKIRFDAGDTVRTGRYKLLLPVQSSQMLIYGMNFDESTLQRPWKQKSLLTSSATNPETGRFTVSFDPADLLPAQLKDHKVSVLEDRGSSVLFLIGK